MLVSFKHKKLLLNLREPERVTTVIPSAKTIQYKGRTVVVVPHRLDEVRVLRNLGFDAPAPVASYYEYQGRFDPFIHQRTTVEFLTTNPRAFCLNGMGCIEGDARIRVSRKSKSYETTLRELHGKFHELPDKHTWKARSLKDGVFGMNTILDVVAKGVKPTLRITLADGKCIRATPDHRMARPDGSWTDAGALQVGDELVTNGRVEVVVAVPKASKIVSIEYGGEVDVYDLCMEAPHHNFVVNGIVVHNSGKTISVLWAFDYLRKAGLVKRMLVIGPLSTLERAWGDEIYRNFPDMSFAVLHGTREKRHKLLAADFDVYIINHDGIKSKDTLELLSKREGLDVIVPDEIAEFRNASTDRWKALNLLCNGSEKLGWKPKNWVWGLTGTPIPNAPTDAWAQVRIINPGRVAKYFGHFQDRVMKKITAFKWAPREGALEIVREAMQPAVRFSREECIDLPPTTYITRHAPLTAEQKRAFDEMLKKFKTEYAGGEINAVNAAVKLSKLLQICSGEVLSATGPITIPSGPRMDLVKELIDESEAKVLVFVPFTAVLHALADELRKHYTVEVVYGGVPKGERDRIFQVFQNSPNPRVMVCHPACMAHGLTLTAASTTVWYGPPPSNNIYMQANERTPRPGQKLQTLIAHIEGSAIERMVYDRMQGKKALQGVLLDLLKGA